MRRRFQHHNLKSDEKIAQALSYIDSYINENGYSPSVREIAEALEVPSSSTMAKAIEYISNEGYLYEPTKFSKNGNRIARTLRVTESGYELIKEHA